MTAEGKALKEAYQWDAKSQWKGPPLDGDAEVSVRFFFKTKRKRDLDNQNKLILDALSGIAYEDDSQISSLNLSRDYDARNPAWRSLAQPRPLNKPQCSANLATNTQQPAQGAENGMD
jgi:hypothetical protein